ncbi:MAG: DNA alkylation repair protein [Thermodesulfobacteriota bacterium]|nr:DNA alkylation repair protein [Thermodesulfobacteriota bacterium]
MFPPWPFIIQSPLFFFQNSRIEAEQLWKSGIHECRILACMVDDLQMVTEEQLESWVKDFKSWDVCDQCCSNFFVKTEFAYRQALEWSQRSKEFVKRAGFVLMAQLAVHDKWASDSELQRIFPIIKRESRDERNFVKKAANWALRQIGKRNHVLNKAAIETAKEIHQIDSKTARWIANHALRELTSDRVQLR